jgi:hypothetical protein
MSLGANFDQRLNQLERHFHDECERALAMPTVKAAPPIWLLSGGGHANSGMLAAEKGLDDRFHETGIDETGSMELEGCWWIPRLRLAERGAVSWQDGVKRSRWR